MSQAPRIAVIIGTRAQFIKTAPVMRLLEKRNIPYRFIFTAQHRETIEAIRANFGVKAPDFELMNSKAEAKTIKLFGGWAFRAFWALLFRRHEIIPFDNGIVLNHGDTATCLWGTLLARLTGNEAMHLESGLRSFHLFKPFPEELIRLLTFALSTVYACPNDWALNNVKRYRGKKINTELNTLYDAVQLALTDGGESTDPTVPTPYAVVSIHRFEHIFRPAALRKIIDRLDRIAGGMDLVFVAHPATVQQLDKLGLRKRLDDNPHILIRDRMPFFEFVRLIAKSEFVITDGGSNQEELFYLGKPTLVLRQTTERSEGMGENAVLAEDDDAVIDQFCANYSKYHRPALTASQSPSKAICDWLASQGFAAKQEGSRQPRVSIWRVLLAVGVLSLAAGYLWANQDALLSYLSNFNPVYAPWLVLTAAASIAVNAMIMNQLVRQFGVRLHAWECFGLTAAGSLANYLPLPQANGVVRGVYLKREHNMPYDSFVTTVMVTYLMALPAIGVLGLICLAVIFFSGTSVTWPLWLLFAGLTSSVLLFGPAMGLLRPFRRFEGFKQGLATLMRSHILGRMVVLQTAQLLLTGIALWLSFSALGAPVAWSASLMVGLLANTAGILNVTPGNIGVIESATALGAHLLEGDAHLAVVAYSVYRVASILMLATVSGAFVLFWKKGSTK